MQVCEVPWAGIRPKAGFLSGLPCVETETGTLWAPSNMCCPPEMVVQKGLVRAVIALNVIPAF